jgi:hypothetical protein
VLGNLRRTGVPRVPVAAPRRARSSHRWSHVDCVALPQSGDGRWHSDLVARHSGASSRKACSGTSQAGVPPARSPPRAI